MKPRTPLHQKRWTLRLFEWGGLACVVLILLVVFLRCIERLQVEAEQHVFQTTVDALETAVRITSLLQDHRPVAYGALLENGNPMPLLERVPGWNPNHYLGELDQPDPQTIAGGLWYFDRPAGVLVYRVRNSRFIDTELSGPARVPFRVVPRGTGQAAAGPVAPLEQGVLLDLVPQAPFHWK
jgi:hypothetical protein